MNGQGALWDSVRRTASHHRHEPALSFIDRGLVATTYTFQQLVDRVEELARAVAARSIGCGAPVGLLLRTQESQALHFLGTMAAGRTPAILTPPHRKLNRAYYTLTLQRVLAQSLFAGLITDIPDLNLPGAVYEAHSLRCIQSDVPTVNTTLRLGPFLQFSSGTTGIKRGVVLTDEAVIQQVHLYAQALNLAPQDRILSWLPLYHDMGLIACLVMPLIQGIHCLMLDPLDWVANPLLYLQAVSQYHATLSWHPNFAFAFMADRIAPAEVGDLRLDSLRALINCSEPVTWESQKRFLQRFKGQGLRSDVFAGCYAMAETTFALTHGTSADQDYLDPIGPVGGQLRPDAQPFVSVGHALPGVMLQITNERGHALPERYLGEIWVRSPFTMQKYFHNTEATHAAFQGDWYKTGDLGYLVGSALFVRGRKKDVLIVNGTNYFPEDIEEAISQIPGVRPGRVAVFSEFDPVTQSERVIALAESDEQDGSNEELILGVRQGVVSTFQLTNFSVAIVPPEWLIKSSAGKTARSANKEKWRAAMH